MIVRPLFVGLFIAIVMFLVFLFLGPLFFVDGRQPFQINFVAGAVLGLILGMIANRLAGAPRARAVRAMALVAVPGLLIMAGVGSHFSVFFPALDPALDKVFGSWMLWFYGFALIGALAIERQTETRETRQ